MLPIKKFISQQECLGSPELKTRDRDCVHRISDASASSFSSHKENIHN